MSTSTSTRTSARSIRSTATAALLAGTVIAGATIPLAACEEQGEHPRERAARVAQEEAAKKAQAEAEADRLKPKQSSGGQRGESRSVLGKARDSALRIQDKAEQRDKEISDLADQVHRGGG